MWSGERLTKIKATTRPDLIWSEVCTTIGIAAQNREQQERAKEKPKLDNAQRLRRIYFVDPDDEEYKLIPKNGRRKLERPMAPAMPCKRLPNSITEVVAKLGLHPRRVPKQCMVYSGISRIHKVKGGIFSVQKS